MSPSNDYSYDILTKSSTGSICEEQYKYITVSYGRFEIELCLAEDGRFVGVTEVRVKKDFLSIDQRIANTSFFDVAQFYQD